MTSARPVALRAVRTVPVDDPGPLLGLLPDADALAWVRSGEGMVGWGVAARGEFTGPDPFGQAEAWWADLVAGTQVLGDGESGGRGLVAFGSFAFDSASASSVLVVPQVLVGHRAGAWWVTVVTDADGPGGGEVAVPRLGPADRPRSPGAIRYADGAVPGPEWTAVVADAVVRIGRGEVSKIVLARDVEARAQGPLDLRWPLQRLAAGYPECWTFAVDGLLGATPEMLLSLRDGLATSRVLAGTRRRGGDPAQDRERASALLSSTKDLAEHGYGVRSVANALAPHCGSMTVSEEPFVLALPNVLHLATDVTGTVLDGSTSLGLVASLHPSAAVCGTPTDVARRLIRHLEGMNRGRYAGPVGWMDATGDGEWGIALRCAEVDRDDPARLRLFAGCGIVAGSQPVEELAESAAKLVPMRDALES